MKLGFGHGKIVVAHSDGWACSKEAEIDFEVDIMPGGVAKKSIAITIKGLFAVVGEVIKGDAVYGIFKYENGTKIAFEGKFESRQRIKVIGHTNNDFETTLKKISQWQEQFKEN